ncbi:protein fluG [Xylariaceae sp. FL1272]|nr:protein fluG [Xylariaceae sp. FL1272]
MLTQFLNSHTYIKYIRLQWVDYSGVIHCRLVTASKAARMTLDTTPYKVPVNSLIIPISTSPGCDASPPQVWELHPEWDTLRVCAYTSAHAMVMCSLTQSGSDAPFSMCPRKLLDRVSKEAMAKGLEVQIGFELETVLLDESLQVPGTLDRIEGFSMSAGIRGHNLPIVEEIIDALEASDVSLHHVHTEATDQLEFSLEPMPPIEAVDALVYAQEAIRAIAIRHNRKATLTPKPFLSRFPTNGLHLHISVAPEYKADHFLAGILGNLKALCAFGLPSYDSYHRVEDDGTGRWVGWGTENRDLPLRGIGPGHWEFRPADATANFYICVAALLSCALSGVITERPLSWKDCRVFPETLTSSELESYGISENLPSSLLESINHLKANRELRKQLHDALVDKYVKVKDKEIELFSKMTDEERRRKFLAFF